MSGYKVFNVSYRWEGRFQTYESKELIVIAETEGVALSLAVHQYPETDCKLWTATEIPTDTHYVHFVSSASS